MLLGGTFRHAVIALAIFASLCLFTTKASAGLLFRYTADIMPSSDGWAAYGNTEAYEISHATIENGAIHLIDDSTIGGSYLTYGKQFLPRPGYSYSAEFDLKVLSGTDTAIYLSDGATVMCFALHTDKIMPTRQEDVYLGSYSFDTTGYNTYRIDLESGRGKLYINGNLAIDEVAGTLGWGNVGAGVEFALGASAETGEAFFSEIRAYENAPVPEPATMLLMVVGSAGLAGLRKRFRKKLGTVSG